jgi:hypothetical protein
MAATAFTQLAFLTEVPGLHFDEAWQGLLAQRIASEPGFWPFTAMNSYTSPVVHYVLAVAFKVFGPSLGTMRGFYAALNFTSLGIFATVLWRRHGTESALWFTLMWALLPLSVHLHRFSIEMNGWFGFCLALIAAGFHMWNKRPRWGIALVLLGYTLGLYSHILFLALLLGWTAARFRWVSAWKDGQSVGLLASGLLITAPLLLRMYLGLHSGAALALAFLPPIMLVALGFTLKSPRKGLWTRRWSRFFHGAYRWALLGCLPFLIAFIFLFWDGSFAYSQVTGWTGGFWIPVNAVLLLLSVGQLHRRFSLVHLRNPHDSVHLWKTFVFTFLISSVLILKQSPRYYTVPMILLMAALSIGLMSLKRPGLKAVLALVFIAWNSYAFVARYLVPFQQRGATAAEFQLLIYKDSARDFRPFQRVFAWLEEQGCGRVIRGVEDDRFLAAVEFLRLTSAGGQCPWIQDELIFRTIPPRAEDYQSNLDLLASRPEWGDRGLWKVKGSAR